MLNRTEPNRFQHTDMLKQLIERGEYHIPGEDIAQAILDDLGFVAPSPSLPYCKRAGCPHKAEPDSDYCLHCLSDIIFLENACFAAFLLPLVGVGLIAVSLLVFAGRSWGWW